MSHTNSTTNYNLPQFVTTDKPAWLTDVNNAYSAIDNGIHAAKTSADNAQTDATQALSDAAGAASTANSANSKAAGAIASIAETFLDSATYAEGDKVMYNNLLYVCHTDVNVPGAWTGSTNWTRTDIDSIVSSMPSSLEELSDTTITSPANDQTLGYNGSKWVNKDNTLNNLSNVNMSPTAGHDILVRNFANTFWTNLPIASLVKTKTVEGTTTASGAIAHGLDLSSRFIICATGADVNNINKFGFLRCTDDTYLTVFEINNGLRPFANSAVKLTVYYL